MSGPRLYCEADPECVLPPNHDGDHQYDLPDNDVELRRQTYRENRLMEGLEEWWLANAKREAEKLGPKAVEYGSYDLELIGDVLHTIIDHSSNRSRPKDLESGIIFYLIGKIARLASALRDGHEPSDDTFLDISIYARMALYIREKGQWP